MTCSGASDNRITNPDSGQCKCLDRFYDNNVLSCAECHYSCLNCINSKIIIKKYLKTFIQVKVLKFEKIIDKFYLIFFKQYTFKKLKYFN